MATKCKLAPLINVNFYLTGAWGEQRATHKHAGVDLSTGQKAPVYSMYDGTVITVDGAGTTGSGYGPYIIIKSDDGYAWLYGDLSSFSGFSIGDRVKAGQYISREGNPAGTSSTGTHVHAEVEFLGDSNTFKYGYANSLDPTPFMGIENVVNYSKAYIYDGTPVPPEPPEPPTPTTSTRSKFPWVLYARKLRS